VPKAPLLHRKVPKASLLHNTMVIEDLNSSPPPETEAAFCW